MVSINPFLAIPVYFSYVHEDVNAVVARPLEKLPLLRDWKALHRHDELFPNRAFIVEFAGMPKAGKSTSIEGLRHFFSHGYRTERWRNNKEFRYQVHTPAEGVSLRTPIILKQNKLDFNTWAGAYAIQELLQASHDPHHHLVVLDRGPWDASCWLEYWNEDNHGESEIEREHLKAVIDFFRLPYWMTRSDLHILLLVKPEEALRREEEKRLIKHTGAGSDQEMMTRMRAIYEAQFSQLRSVKAETCPHVGDCAAVKIDTSELTTKQLAAAVIEAALNVLQKKVAHAVEDFTFKPGWMEIQLHGYLQGMKLNVRNEVQAFFPEFCNEANRLNPERRHLVLIQA